MKKLFSRKVREPEIKIGWQEWCHFDQLGIVAIKAKVDTGAKTSCIHAVNIKPYTCNDKYFVKFDTYPLPKRPNFHIHCQAPVVDYRYVMSSTGHREKRYVIRSKMRLSDHSWEVDITLTDREPLSFRMLLGRDAMKNHCIIYPGKTLLQGKYSKEEITMLYQEKG